MTLPKRGDPSVPGERPTSEYSPLAIAVARERGLLRVDRDGLGWISGMEPDGPAEGRGELDGDAKGLGLAW